MKADVVARFVDSVIANSDYTQMDKPYLYNRVLALVGEEGLKQEVETTDLIALKDELLTIAAKNGKVGETQNEYDNLGAELMNFIMPAPSVLNQRFWQTYETDKNKAIADFYALSKQNDYIKTKAIAKNIAYSVPTQYGDIEITINLSKPEKDPKAIAAAKKMKQTGYPKCQLCIENEGYQGRLDYPARADHRIIRFDLGNKTWGFQYSPYAYFNEHCIFLDGKHEPMAITAKTFSQLLAIVERFPGYFAGSNADLPIVGGSILTHEHYQGGKHIFPMMKASIKRELHFAEYPAVDAGIVNWPMSDIRLTSTDTEQLIDLGTHIIKVWDQYSDESLDIKAFDGQTRHHTVTPIMHREGDKFVLDLVLRDNNINDEYPLGIFHPHEKLWHIKKENIGLIEVMGRAILPARLKDELNEVKKFWLGAENKIADSHLSWAKEVQSRINLTADNVDEVMEQELANVFANVLENAGVFKDDVAGNAGWQRFVDALK